MRSGGCRDWCVQSGGAGVGASKAGGGVPAQRGEQKRCTRIRGAGIGACRVGVQEWVHAHRGAGRDAHAAGMQGVGAHTGGPQLALRVVVNLAWITHPSLPPQFCFWPTSTVPWGLKQGLGTLKSFPGPALFSTSGSHSNSLV